MKTGKISFFDDFELTKGEDEYLQLVNAENEYAGYFYDTDEFAFALAKTIDSGEITPTFTGEDGARWGYKVKPNEVRDLLFTWEVGDVMKEPYKIASWPLK